MPTIAELQINLDSRPIEQGTKALTDFAAAADKASKAGKVNQQMNDQSSTSADKAAKSEADLSSMIDAQTRKLEQLGTQRRKLEQSGMKSTMPSEYERLNRIIDANIGLVQRQGSAVDALNGKQNKDVAKREAALQAEFRAQERIVDAAIRQENIVSRASAKQQQQIESTINGLSRQVKAQNDYNATIEKLNRARAIGPDGNMGSGSSLSSGEYESYVKLAQAKRDAALATEDNSRAVLQAQSKLDTYTATLGKVERAEVEYARAVGVLNQAQKMGLITVDQYDQKLASFATKREKSVAAANDSSAAEQRFARELHSVMSAYDPVIRAQDQYNTSVRILSQGLQGGVLSVEQFNKALTEQRVALEGVKNAKSGMGDLGTEYDAALNRLVPYRAELRNLEQQEKVLRAQKDAGKVTTDAQIKDYDKATNAIQRHRTELEKRIKSGGDAALSYKQEQAALRGMPAQITDIVVSLQGGQAPLTVLLQQGGQIKDMFGGIGPAIKGLSTALMSMISPVTVIGAGVALLGAAAYSGSQEITDFNRALIQSANASGVSTSQFAAFRNQLDDTTTTAGKAAEALTQIASSGKIAGDQFVAVAEAAVLMEKATGQAMSKTIEDFASLGKEPVDAAIRLDEKYHFLTASVLAQADALVKQGRETEAVTLLQSELSIAATDTAKEMIDQAGYIERAWSGVKSVITETWDALKNVGRESTAADEMRALITQRELLENRQKNNKDFFGGIGGTGIQKEIDDTKALIKQKQLRLDYERLAAEEERKTETTRRESVSAQASSLKRYESSIKGVEKAENELGKVRRENEKIKSGGNVSAEQNAIMIRNEARAVKELADANEKANKPKAAGALDTTAIQEVKSNLTTVTAEYEGYYKRVTALGEANLVSDEATYHSQKAILEAQSKAVSASYDDQINAINNLRDNKKNSTAQNISLDNQLTKAQADQAVALEKIDAKKDALAIKEKGRIDEMKRNVSAYKAALDSQLEGLVNEGARATDGVGRGSRQSGVSKQMADVDRNFSKQQRELAKSLGEGMDPSEYADKLRDLEDTHTKMTSQIIKNDSDIQKANYDWTNGFTAAVENAQDAGMNFAGTVEGALTGAFNNAGSALATFVTTGKLNFKDFALSVMADMATMAAKQAAMGALGSILSIAGAAAGAYMGGGANGFAAGSAAANSSAAGASSAGYGNTYYQAKGGAWSGGTQMFAQGGAFTNSVVSNPTSFGMANGSRGIMGEAGDEAIVPLARTRNGDLGVRMMGGGNSGGGTVVQVNVNVADGGTSSSSDGGAGWDQFGSELGSFVEQRVYKIINSETRQGGSLQSQSGR
jgi:lambda family phage tail tape measure protein